MNCQQIQKLIHAYHDGELDAANTMQVDEHLADCPACFAATRQLSVLRTALQAPELRFHAPAGLRASISTAVRQAAQTEREAPVSRPWYRSAGWAAAAVLLATLLSSYPYFSAQRENQMLAELTASHVRSLMASHLTDVASTDRHTVKPWFDGKIDFAPPVKDLQEIGFPLLGGRLDFIEGHAAAALVYGRHKHILNLFVWPATSTSAASVRSAQRNGYNILRWSDGRMSYSVVSDLNETELRQFADEWSAR
jgi:anti-sigma factor RsiW